MRRKGISRQTKIRQLPMAAQQIDLGGQRLNHKPPQICFQIHGSAPLNGQRGGQNAGCGKIAEAFLQRGFQPLTVDLKGFARLWRRRPERFCRKRPPVCLRQSPQRIGDIAEPNHIALHRRSFTYAQTPHVAAAAERCGRSDHPGIVPHRLKRKDGRGIYARQQQGENDDKTEGEAKRQQKYLLPQLRFRLTAV